MRADVIEAFHVPSTSMVPTIHVGDRILSGKGPLLGTPAPGDVLVYTPSPDRDWIQRVMGLPGQTLDDTDDGVVVDGKKLPSEVVDAKFSYDDVKPDGSTERRRGMVVREHLGARSYLLLRGAAPRVRGPWKVPANTLFFMGDNRLNANDSRYNPPAPRSSVTGRVLTVWWAMNGNVPDWERIGTPIE